MKLKIVYHFPFLDNIYAQRTIYNGFKNAFTDLGHEFITFTAGDDLKKLLAREKPDMFITSSHFFYQKFLDYELLKEFRKKGMMLFAKIDFWNSPISKLRVNEAKSMKDDIKTINLIKKGFLGDIFFHVVEQEDERMQGFVEGTGKRYFTIPLAADKTVIRSHYDKKFESDIAYLGTYLPDKREFFKERVFPLRYQYDLKLYGQDWTFADRSLGFVQKVGQYFNIPLVRSIQKPKFKLEDEAKIYSSSTISINVHEQYQREFGGDCNERTFKIPLCGGFEVTDDVACIRKYFKEGEEIIIAKDKSEWFEKIDYFLRNPEKRESIIQAGKKKVLKEHTYHNRVDNIIKLYNSFIGSNQSSKQ